MRAALHRAAAVALLRLSESAQSASSAHDGGPDGPEMAEGTPPSGTPSPAQDPWRGTSRGTSRRPPGNNRPTPGQVALSAQSGAPTGHAPPLALLGPLRRTIQHAGRSTAPGRDPHPSLLDYTHAATGARVLPPNPWAGGFTPATDPAPVAAEPAAAPATDAEAATAAPAAGAEGGGVAMAVDDDDDEGASAAAPRPVQALRAIHDSTAS